MTEILIKRLSDKVVLPKYETEGSSGMDLAAHINETVEIKPGSTAIIPTGIAVSIPKNIFWISLYGYSTIIDSLLSS